MAFATPPAVAQLISDVQALEAKISEPTQDDVLNLIRVFEQVSRANKIIDEDDPEGEVKAHLLEAVKRVARFLVISFLPLEELRLTREAEAAISSKDERTLRRTTRGIERLDEGTGKVAYDYGWIKWKERPWHVYDVSRSLKEKFVATTGCGSNKLLDWEKDDEYHRHMDWL
jgi:hypothetical protein